MKPGVKRHEPFLAEHDLDNWVQVAASKSVEQIAEASFLIWDFDSGIKREVLMASAYKNLAPGGVMYVDDMHSGGIEFSCNELEGTRIGDTPRDGFGRYGTFIRKL